MAIGSGLSTQAPPQQTGTKRTDLQRYDLSAPGREAIQVRVDFDPGYVSPKHTHFGEEIIYVLEGTLEYEIEGKPPVKVKAGDVVFVPAGAAHVAKNVGWALTGEAVDDVGMAELLEPYRPHRYRVQRLVELSGAGRPRRGPRMAPRTHLPRR